MLRLQCSQFAKKRITSTKPMPKAGPDVKKKILRTDVWWVKLTKLYQATPFYKLPKFFKEKINNLPPYVDRSTLGILIFSGTVFGIVYGRNEYIYRTQSKLHTNNNYVFDAVKLIEQDFRLKMAFGGEVIFQEITKNAVNEYEEDPVDGTITARCFCNVKGVNSAWGRVAVEAHRDKDFNWELQRVYLDFFRDEDAKPLFIQIFPEIKETVESNS